MYRKQHSLNVYPLVWLVNTTWIDCTVKLLNIGNKFVFTKALVLCAIYNLYNLLCSSMFMFYT